MTATQSTEAAKWDTVIGIARYIEANPFITERELLAAGFSRIDLERTVARTTVTRTPRPYGRTFYSTRG